MACFHPLEAYQTENGRITFNETRHTKLHLTLPCGKCIGCRIQKQRAWAIRCMNEAQMHLVNSFITLTYSEEHYTPTLDHTDWQKFMYRLRAAHGPTRFFMCGEYGDQNGRPHFHAILFGRTFQRNRAVGTNIYESDELNRLWPWGMASHGEVTYQSAAYCARYNLKKITGPMADEHYKRVNLETGEIITVKPEYARMSLKPGIGYTWIMKYHREVYNNNRDAIIQQGGKQQPTPRYYDQQLEKINSDLYENKQYERYKKAGQFQNETTPERLKVREQCAIAKIKHKRQSKL